MTILIDGEIVLHGTVGEGFFADGFTARDVIEALAEVGRSKDVTVRLNSGGGIATEGVAIFNALESHRGNVNVVVDGVAASAASIIAMAGDTIVMKTGASMMVHDPAAFTMGNSDDHAKSIEALEMLASSMADIYAERSGRKPDEIREEMKAETWMTAKEAVAKGYADKIEKSRSKEPTAFDYRLYQHAPERMVALAVARDWKQREPTADVAANPRQIEEPPMTDAEKAAADQLAADKAKADAAVVTTPAETPEQMTARITAEVNKRSADIVAACAIARKPDRAAAFIADMSKSVGDVLAALNAERAAAPGNDDELNARSVSLKDVVASWDKQVEKQNARVAK